MIRKTLLLVIPLTLLSAMGRAATPIPHRAKAPLGVAAQQIRLDLMVGRTTAAEIALLDFDPSEPAVAVLDAWAAMQRRELLDPSAALLSETLASEDPAHARPASRILAALQGAVRDDGELAPFAADVVYEAGAMELLDVLAEGRGVVLGDFTLYSNEALHLGSAYSTLPSYGVHEVRDERPHPPEELLQRAGNGAGFFVSAIGWDLHFWARRVDPTVVERWRAVYEDLSKKFAGQGRYGSAAKVGMASGVLTVDLNGWFMAQLEDAQRRAGDHVRTLQIAAATLLEASPEFASAWRDGQPGQLAALFDGFRAATPPPELAAALLCAGIDDLDALRQRGVHAADGD